MTSNWAVEGLSVSQGGFSLGPIDLTLRPGETLAVIGRSGSGKTTLLRAIAGFLPTDAGRIRRDDEDVGRLPPERRRAVYVPAGLGLFPDRTVRANLAFPRHVRGDTEGAAIRVAAERFGISEFLDRSPRTLSEGQRERVAVARATLAEPSILLWDEPLGALDVESRGDLLEALGELRRTARFPVLLVTHDSALGFSLADRFLVLDGGRATFSGSAERLVESPSDSFVGRFVGYANVFERETLEALAAGSALSRELLALSGSAGVGAAPFPPAPAGSGAHSATIERVIPNPDGHRLVARSEGLAVVLQMPRGAQGSRAKAGDTVRFDVDAERWHPLGSGTVRS
ncbi:MAG: ABC transporter ATP-binding protein [Thermoplasmata archaeon]|nr:ABC transporter ATP-binding protein [Thermoplasmata archaeon]MCI4356357.1 ABC transporter ATP-binding protein [Thermoplasmata archaeon]